jgi:hypothetical protein
MFLRVMLVVGLTVGVMIPLTYLAVVRTLYEQLPPSTNLPRNDVDPTLAPVVEVPALPSPPNEFAVSSPFVQSQEPEDDMATVPGDASMNSVLPNGESSGSSALEKQKCGSVLICNNSPTAPHRQMGPRATVQRLHAKPADTSSARLVQPLSKDIRLRTPPNSRRAQKAVSIADRPRVQWLPNRKTRSGHDWVELMRAYGWLPSP